MSIITSIKKLMRLSNISKQLTSQELLQLQLAMSTLMMEMIRADFIELQKEKKVMHEVLFASMDLTENEVNLLIEKAEIQSDFTLSLGSHTSVINNFLTSQEKQKFIKNLWVLANIDDELHTLEMNMLTKVASQLGYNETKLSAICGN